MRGMIMTIEQGWSVELMLDAYSVGMDVRN